jgi:pyruvate,water dikinase
MKALLYFYIVFLSIFFVRSQDSIKYLSLISTEQEYALLKGNPNTSKFGEVDAIKVLFDLNTDSVYFINSNLYDYHVSFCMDYLSYPHNSWKFNYDNYTTIDHRDYLMGTINRFYNKNLYTLEFSVADNIKSDQIKKFHKRIINHFRLSSEIKLFINTNRMQSISNSLNGIKTINVDDIYKGQTIQILNQKESYGKLIFIEANEIEAKYVKAQDIVVIKGTPKELPPVAGLITTDFQTPLSHITILCQNRGTPIIALKKAWSDSLLRSFEGQPVYFNVKQDSFELKKSDFEQIEAYWNKKRNEIQMLSLYKDSSIKEILPIELVNKNSINIVGGKAANFGELEKIIGQLDLNSRTPECAFAIPFYFYLEHLKVNKIDSVINQFIASNMQGTDDKELREFLSTVRHQIVTAQINPDLIKNIEKIVSKGAFKRIRFRSSTNAEDIKGFNGAGLYDSKTGILDNDDDKSFAVAIKKVWASAWNYKAFMERQYFGIDQKTIAMGVLCHRSFPDEKANGVVITKNLYRNNYRGFVINAQFGETSVVNPPDGTTCEQMICYSDKNDSFYGKKNIVEYLSYSNILPDTIDHVLSTNEVTLLTKEISQIKKAYYDKFHKKSNNDTYYNYGLDLEFKIYGPERLIYIKQVRPFKN